MEKQSESRQKESLSSSTPTAERIQKRKVTMSNIDDRDSLQPVKIHKVIEQTYSISQIQSQNPNMQGTQSQPLSQETKLEELEVQLGSTDLKIENLRQKFWTVKKYNESLAEYIEGEVKVWNELIEKQNISENRRSIFREQTAMLRDTFIGFKEHGNTQKTMYNNVIWKRREVINRINDRLNNEGSKEEKELEERVTSKINELLNVQVKCNQLENQMTESIQVMNKSKDKWEEQEKISHENRQKYDEEMKKFSDIVKDIEAKLNKEREEKSELLARCEENLKRFEEQVTEYKGLQVFSTKNAKQIECLKSSVQELEEKRANLNSEIDQLKHTHLAVISEKDPEFADYRRQLEDLKLEYSDTSNKLSEITSNNENLWDDIAKSVQGNEELRKSLLNKDDELMRLREDLNNASEKNKELSAQSESLNEKLLAQKEMLLDTRVDLENHDAKENGNRKRESELRMRLTGAKQKLENKTDEVAELHKKLRKETLRSSNEMKKFRHDIELLDKRIIELSKVRVNLQREKECIETEDNRKLQQINYLSTECQRAEHEKQIMEQNSQIEILCQQISVEKLKVKQWNIKKVDNKEKEKHAAHLKEMKSNIEDLEKLISATEDQQRGHMKTLKKAQTLNEAQSTITEESLNSSKLIGMMFAKHQSLPTSSTPEHSPLQSRKIHFEFESSSDMSSINGLDIFEDAQRHYADFLLNKTDNAKLN